MKHLSNIFLVAILVFVIGCSASTTIIGPVTLPTSGKVVDVVQHRSDSRGCAELVVIQTFDAAGILLDSQQGRARSLPCTVVEVGIEAGSRVGSAALIANGLVIAAKATRPDNIDINNSNSQGQTQSTKQTQGQSQSLESTNINVNSNANTNSNHNVWHGGNVHNEGGASGGGEGAGHGNNGGGNGSDDGTNPGTGHHHDNGDNS